MTVQTSADKHSQNRAAHYISTRQAWRASKPYLELDDCTIPAEEAPSPCPPSRRTVDSVGVIERQGVTVIVPSPWISKLVNGRAAAFWKAHGFELRDVDNSPHVTEGYVVEWVRFCDKPLRGRRFSAKAWLEWATVKHKELYL